ncbi:unnamed protein product [Cunninghamella blakesleeana]
MFISSYLLLIVLSCHYFILPISCQQANGRIVPGCTLLNDHIYCYGGYAGSANNNGIAFSGELNDNIVLDLTVFDDFSTLDKTKIKWTTKSKYINGTTPLPSVGQIATTKVSDGTILFYGGKASHGTTMPFLHYNPQTDTWNNITVPNNTYFARNQILDIGNGKIWIFGGVTDTETWGQNYFYIYDYQNNLWPVIQSMLPEEVSLDYSATLVNDLIYIIGGAQPIPPTRLMLNDFNTFKTYNTIDGSWNNFTAGGPTVAPRGHHTTIATMDKKHLLIYGGSQALETRFEVSQDYYYVYDIANNSLQLISIPYSTQVTNGTRFGHYASLYKTNYMLLVFGFRDMFTAADNFNVLNIQDPYNPKWIDLPNDQPQPDLKTIIPAVVVPSCLVLLGLAIGLYFYIKHQAFQLEELEKEDPRKLAYPQKADELTMDGTTVVRSEGSEYQNNNDNQPIRPSLTENTDDKNLVYGKLHLPTGDDNNGKQLYGKLNLPEEELGKPYEEHPTIKPSESS